jgi:solute carrier family 35 protein E1
MASMSGRDPSPHQTFKFPAFQPDLMPMPEEDDYGHSSSRTASPSHMAQTNGSTVPADRWQPRKESRFGYANGAAPGPSTRHGRQKSLSEAIRTVRTRKGSVSQNVHEIADALKAPLSPTLIVGLTVQRETIRSANMSRCSVVSGT